MGDACLSARHVITALTLDAQRRIFRPRSSLRAGNLGRVDFILVVIESPYSLLTLFWSLFCCKMSDYEDNMDVDVSKDVQFSSSDANGKAKRTAADLPVEAQDNLPW